MPREKDGRFVPHRTLRGNFHPHMPHPHLRHGAETEKTTYDETARIPRLVLTPEQSAENQIRMKEAQAILGKDFLGPDAVRRTFGVEISPAKIPMLDTDTAKLRHAKAEGLRLSLRINESADGLPLTIKHMEELLEPVFSASNLGKVINNDSISLKYNFFRHSVPRAGWFFVSKAPAQGTEGKTYLGQSYVMGRSVDGSEVLSDKTKRSLAHPIHYLTLQYGDFEALTKANPEQAVKTLSFLTLNKAVRQTPVEAVYDLLMYFISTGERLLPQKISLAGGAAATSYTHDSDYSTGNSHFIGVGNFTAEGIQITEHAGNESAPNIGSNLAFPV